MSRQELIEAVCDLFGYNVNDFTTQCFTDIWWYWLTPSEQSAVKEYVEVTRALQTV